MMMETTVNRITPQRACTSHTSQSSEKTGQTVQAAMATAVDQNHIAQRAYELYEQRGRQEGQALEDWFNAEHQLAGAAGK